MMLEIIKKIIFKLMKTIIVIIMIEIELKTNMIIMKKIVIF